MSAKKNLDILEAKERMLKFKRLSVIMAAAVLATGLCTLGTSAAAPDGGAASASAQTAASSGTSSAPISALTDPEGAAKQAVQSLINGDYGSVVAQFNDTMKSLVNAAALEELWEAYAPKLGQYYGITGTQVARQGDEVGVSVNLSYELYNLTVLISFDKDGKIEGFFQKPAVKADYKPTTVAGDGFKEITFMFQSGSYKLPAVLTLPTSGTNLPAAVLISGSGPNDRDETIGPNKPFKDIADGLAKKGIATLRYDKRTLAYPSDTATLEEEYTEDAVNAVKYLESYSGINPSKVFLIGHSEGAMLAPRISLSVPNIAGMVLLAGSSRRLEDIMVDQIALRDPADLAAAKAAAAEIKTFDNMPTPPDETILGAPASYWKDLDSQDPATDAIKSNKPMLIMQGERDAQVFMTDYNLWKTKLSGFGKVQYKLYPKLNHLFLEGTGPANVEEYNNPGTVPAYVVDDMASFIAPSAKPITAGGTAAAAASAGPATKGAPTTSVSHIANPDTGSSDPALPFLLFIPALLAAALVLARSRRAKN